MHMAACSTPHQAHHHQVCLLRVLGRRCKQHARGKIQSGGGAAELRSTIEWSGAAELRN